VGRGMNRRHFAEAQRAFKFSNRMLMSLPGFEWFAI
jgi:hypothetical protein